MPLVPVTSISPCFNASSVITFPSLPTSWKRGSITSTILAFLISIFCDIVCWILAKITFNSSTFAAVKAQFVDAILSDNQLDVSSFNFNPTVYIVIPAFLSSLAFVSEEVLSLSSDGAPSVNKITYWGTSVRLELAKFVCAKLNPFWGDVPPAA